MGKTKKPGGHIEPGETPEQAAIRETQEEFSITPKDLSLVTVRIGLAKEYGTPAYFICTDFDGEVRCYDRSEMIAPQWADLGAILQTVEAGGENLFVPFADSFRVLNDVFSREISENPLPKGTENTIISIDGEFNEEDHPRDENGQFTSTGGSSSESEEKGESGKKEPDTPESLRKEMTDMLTNGRIKPKVSKDQAKHREGSEEYKKAVAAGRHPSTTTLSDDEILQTFNEQIIKGGEGAVIRAHNGNIRVNYDFGKPIGTSRSRNGSDESKTSFGTFHLGMKGIHFVPEMQNGKGEDKNG